MGNVDLLIAKFYEKFVDFAPSLVSALVLLIIGIYSIRFIDKIIRKIMSKRNFEPTLINFLANFLFWTLRILLFVTVISQLGVGTSSLVAILGAAGLAVGLSLQGSLSNFAGGILIILFKPFKVGDVIEAQGVIGTVSQIQIFVTLVNTANNQVVFIPNGNLSNGIITNYSLLGYRRADLTFAISYQTDLKKVMGLIHNTMLENPNILTTPEPTVSIKQFSDNAILISVKPCATIENFNAICSDTLANCKYAFDDAGIDIQPFVMSHSKSDI